MLFTSNFPRQVRRTIRLHLFLLLSLQLIHPSGVRWRLLPRPLPLPPDADDRDPLDPGAN